MVVGGGGPTPPQWSGFFCGAGADFCLAAAVVAGAEEEAAANVEAAA